MIRCMSPRIIQIPLSGGDRKAQAKGIRQAHGLSESYYRESRLIRSAAEEKLREPDEAYGYVPRPDETQIRSDEVASFLIYRDGWPIKIIYPDGRVEPFASRDRPNG
jgi:hypothetical protein